jgi:integrase
MGIRRTDGRWKVDAQPGGRGGKRFRKTFTTQAEAKAYKAWLTTQVNQDTKWTPERRDTRRLAELIDLWYAHHGVGLKAGLNTYGRLKFLSDGLGNPVADQLRAEDFAAYRARRLAQGTQKNSINREHAYLRSVFNELRRLGFWKRDNPVAGLRQFKVPERELSFLTDEQMASLLAELEDGRNRHAALIAKVCLATGARWSEAETLKSKHVRNGQVLYEDTKSGRVRAVPIEQALQKQLTNHRDAGVTGEQIFAAAYSAFRDAVERIGLELPAGQLTHVLRHTFASHFMMNGGNILTLQKILGHASLTMTMRYAHLSPEHLEEAKRLNPLAKTSKAE